MIHAMDAMRSFALVQLNKEKYIYWTYIFRITAHESVFSHETKCFIVLNANESKRTDVCMCVCMCVRIVSATVSGEVT